MRISAVTTDGGNLLYDPAELEAARVLAVLVPGALSRVDMFDAAEVWRDRGYGIARYRFPGLDGRPVSPALSIDGAAAEIRALAARYPDKPLRLLGFSTGGPVVLTAGAGMTGDLRIAVMATAVERGGGGRTGLAGLGDIARAVWHARSLRPRAIWFEYYKALLFGRAVWRDAALEARARAITAGRKDRIVLPAGAMPRAHTRDLRRWRLPPGAGFAPGVVHLFRGAGDPVFSKAQQERFAARLGGAGVTAYPGHGHLLFASCPEVFDDIYAFFEGAGAGANPGG